MATTDLKFTDPVLGPVRWRRTSWPKLIDNRFDVWLPGSPERHLEGRQAERFLRERRLI